MTADPARRPRLDPTMGRLVVKIGPGEHYVTQNPDEVITTVLGSCVSACIRDPVAEVGGVNHFMLPQSADGTWDAGRGSLRYGNYAMRRLIEDISKRGGRRERLEVKLFGAANLGKDPGTVGESNARFAAAFLAAEGLQPIAQDLRGTSARRLVYYPISGRAFVMALKSSDAIADQRR